MGRTFGKRQMPVPERNVPRDYVVRAAAERRPENPLVGAQLAAEELLHRFCAAMSRKDERGVHMDTLLAMLGSLAGFACIAALMRMLDETGQTLDEAGIFVLGGQNGERYFYGELPNHALLESRLSVWSLVGGAARQLGAVDLPDIGEIAGHVASTVGTDAFGVPRWPTGHGTGDLPIMMTADLWPAVKPLIGPFAATPAEWPIILGLAAQKAIIMGKGSIDPAVAARIVMECAVPMGHVDPSAIDR